MERSEELLNKLVRRAAVKDLSVRDEAIKLGLYEADFMVVDWKEWQSKHRFVTNVREGVIKPLQDSFTQAPDDAITDLLVNRGNRMAPETLEALRAEAQERIAKEVVKSPALAPNTWHFLYNGTHSYPELLTALMPACVRLTGSDWTNLEKVVEKNAENVALTAAFQQVVSAKKAARTEKAKKTREENKAQGIRRQDPFIKALASGQHEKLNRYKMATFDKSRFDSVKAFWLQQPNNVKLSMMYCKPELWEAHRMELLVAWLDDDAASRHALEVTVRLDEWRRMLPENQTKVLERMFDEKAYMDKWPSEEETRDLAVALKLMGGSKGDDENSLSENLQEWLSFRKLSVLAGRERNWPDPMNTGHRAVRAEFEDTLGEKKGTLFFLACDNSKVGEVLPVLDTLTGGERMAAARVVMNFYMYMRRNSVAKLFIKKT